MGCQIVKLRKVHRRTMVGKEIVMKEKMNLEQLSENWP